MDPERYGFDARESNPYAAPSLAESEGHRRSRPLVGYYEEPASRWRRLFGSLVDGTCAILAYVAVCIPAFVLIPGTYEALEQFGDDVEHAPIELIPIGLGFLGVLAFFGLQWYLISTSGQSLGKKAAGTRIVLANDGALPGFVHGVLLRWWVPGLISIFPFAGLLFPIVDTLFIFGEPCRCLHDYISETHVVLASAGTMVEGRPEDVELH